MTGKDKKTKSRPQIPSRNPRRPARAAGLRQRSEAEGGDDKKRPREHLSTKKAKRGGAAPGGKGPDAEPSEAKNQESAPSSGQRGPRRTQEGSRGRSPERNAPSLAAVPRRRRGAEARNTPRDERTSADGSSDEPRKEPSAAGAEESRPDVGSAGPESEPELLEFPSGRLMSVDGGESDSDDIEELPVDSTSEDIGMLGIGSRVYPPNMDFEVFGEHDSNFPEPAPMDDPSVEARIRDIEARLDGLMDGVDFSASQVTPLGQTVPRAQAEEAVDAARELLESDYYRRNFGRSARSKQEGGIDEFGLDPDTEERLRPLIDFLYKRYFRVEVEGVENIPARGRAVVVANHSGALPFDGAMLRAALRQNPQKSRDLRWLAEDFSFYLPFIGVTMNRIGAVRACQENATRLLLTDHVVAVFPEGAEGIKKLYKDRYQLQRFGRGGFVRLCLKTRSPIVPCAIVGAEETNPILYRFDNLSKLIGLDYLPVTPTFPLLGPLGLLPAPTKWRILFGEPISVDEYGPSAAEDHVLVGRLSERVRGAINGLLETGLRRRRSIWL